MNIGYNTTCGRNNQTVFDELKNVMASGIKLVYVLGNHDMLLESGMLDEALPGIVQPRDSKGLGVYYTGETAENITSMTAPGWTTTPPTRPLRAPLPFDDRPRRPRCLVSVHGGWYSLGYNRQRGQITPSKRGGMDPWGLAENTRKTHGTALLVPHRETEILLELS